MKNILIIIFCFIVFFSYSQEYTYVPLVKENVQWNMYDMQGGGICYDEDTDTVLKKYTIQGDTIINNIIYKKFCRINPLTLISEGIGGIREENKKIYYTGKSYGKVSTIEGECLLYDFTKQVGETIKLQESGPSYSINEIDFVSIGNSVRKRYKTKYLNETEYIIEGIGNVTSGLLNIITDIPTCSGYHQEFKLICFSENNFVYKNPDFTDCNLLKKLNAGINDNKEPKFSITPNPIKDYVQISMKENITKDIRLNIINCTGKIVYKKSLDKDREIIPLDFLSKGIYLFQIETDYFQEIYKIIKI